ncbi:MAG: hypothetical protein ACKVU1_07730 [bacterium]
MKTWIQRFSKGFAATFAASVVAAGIAGAAFAQPCDPGSRQFILEYGNSWGHGTQNPSVGSPLEVVGRINKTTPGNPGRPLNYDVASTSEYTFHIVGVDLDQFINNGTAVADSFLYGAGGTITVYYDTSKDAPRPPPINPPNATVPALFIDGTPILVGTIDNLLITFRDGAGSNPDSIGEIRGNVTFTGGDSLAALIAPIWVWNATSSDGSFNPNGYNFLWGGELKNDCIPTGACCFCDSTCQDGLTADECAAQGGVYQGDNSSCATTLCPLVGACCYPDGSCADGVDGADCIAAGGVFYACTPCDQVVCTPEGACCLCDGTCLDGVTAADCATQGGVYQGDNTACATTTCPLIGACCYRDGSCADGVLQADCVAAGGLFYPCLKCDEVTCVNATEPKSWGGLKGVYR